MEVTEDIKKYDDTLLKIFEDENQSVNKFFDAIFGFFSRNSPELIFDTSKHYGKQLLVSNYEKWQDKYLKSQKSPVTSSKRAKNDEESDNCGENKREKCWSDSMNPGGYTNTTNTPTVSKNTSDDVSTRSTKSQNDKEKRKILNFDTTNGAILDNYSWTQTLDDVDLRIPVGENISKEKVKIHIDKKRLKVEVMPLDSSEFEIALEGEFAHPVRMDDCVWLISSGQYIAILIEKTEEKWWDRCLKHESPIDLKKINAERNFHSLSEEDRKRIEKVISDKQREERGEPTSDQVKMESVLRKAWNVEGSPFAGQEFDPSMVEVINSP